MNAVGIDVSKGHSTVAILRPLGEVVAMPFHVPHTSQGVLQLAALLRGLSGETKIIMECTGSYFQPLALSLHHEGFFVSALHAQLIHDFGNNTIRRVKTDKADALKIANYALAHWTQLPRFLPEEHTRRLLKLYSRQYNKYAQLRTMLKNNFISITDLAFPDVNALFTSPPRPYDGRQKWMDFVTKFWHCRCVCDLSEKSFTQRYQCWCKRYGYHFTQAKAHDIYSLACTRIGVLPMNESTKRLVTLAASQLNAISQAMVTLASEMKRLAALLPEYPIVCTFYGVGDLLGPQLMAEIGDARRFPHKGALVRFAGLEPPEYQSGKFQATSRSISKQGSPHLRKTLFLIMNCILQKAPPDHPVFQFLDRKRAQGKHYYNYMTAGSAKFLRIYYARVMEYLVALDS